MKHIGLIFLSILLTGCAYTHSKLCTDGGQPPYDTIKGPFRGKKKCYQAKDETGKYVNNGRYYEWYPNDQTAVVGQYELGKKVGRWIEYNEKGEKISDKYFENGKEIPRP